jgi:hypothetical protein
MLKYILLSFVIIPAILFLSCASQEDNPPIHDWSNIIKDIEIILASEAADSIKASQIRVIFENNGINLSDYREFYDRSTQEQPLKYLVHFKEIEQFIGEDMKKEAQQQRNKVDNLDYRSREKEDQVDKN